eukprot:TRINITY_DN26151_c0_g1_i1.p1 TRINITY_DN26151_c0_g1~~TRINITY_DN26151_c0_g1_i1.p1  ORF type:complete len:1026 (+),score=176.87 TRINITY_DN26151_c0_g1_i1:38-3115(+)
MTHSPPALWPAGLLQHSVEAELKQLGGDASLQFAVAPQNQKRLQYAVNGEWQLPFREMTFMADGIIEFPELGTAAQLPATEGAASVVLLQHLACLAGIGIEFNEARGDGFLRFTLAGNCCLQYTVNGELRPPFRCMTFRDCGLVELPELGRSVQLPHDDACRLRRCLQQLGMLAGCAFEFENASGLGSCGFHVAGGGHLQMCMNGSCFPPIRGITFLDGGVVHVPETDVSVKLPGSSEEFADARTRLQHLAVLADVGLVFNGGQNSGFFRFHIAGPRQLQYSVDGNWRPPFQHMVFGKGGLIGFPDVGKRASLPSEEVIPTTIALQRLAIAAGIGHEFVDTATKKTVRMTIAGNGHLQFTVDGRWRLPFQCFVFHEDGAVQFPDIEERAELEPAQAAVTRLALQRLAVEAGIGFEFKDTLNRALTFTLAGQDRLQLCVVGQLRPAFQTMLFLEHGDISLIELGEKYRPVNSEVAAVRCGLQDLAAKAGLGLAFQDERGGRMLRFTAAGQGCLQYTVDGLWRPPCRELRFHEEDGLVEFMESGKAAKPTKQHDAAGIAVELQRLLILVGSGLHVRQQECAPALVTLAGHGQIQWSSEGLLRPPCRQVTISESGCLDFPEIDETLELSPETRQETIAHMLSLLVAAGAGLDLRSFLHPAGEDVVITVAGEGRLQACLHGQVHAPFRGMVFTRDDRIEIPEIAKVITVTNGAEEARMHVQDLAILAGLGMGFQDAAGAGHVRLTVAGKGLLQCTIDGVWRRPVRYLMLHEDGSLEMTELQEVFKIRMHELPERRAELQSLLVLIGLAVEFDEGRGYGRVQLQSAGFSQMQLSLNGRSFQVVREISCSSEGFVEFPELHASVKLAEEELFSLLMQLRELTTSCGCFLRGFLSPQYASHVRNLANSSMALEDVRFSQRSIAQRFRCQRWTIHDTLARLRSGGVSVSDIPFIHVYFVDGVAFTTGNRRLWVFQQLRLPEIPVIVKGDVKDIGASLDVDRPGAKTMKHLRRLKFMQEVSGNPNIGRVVRVRS